MRDFPIFTTEYGVSSLVLKEIPYKKQAYIRIRDVQEAYFAEHLQECVSFCRMCGAEVIFAEGNDKLEAPVGLITADEVALAGAYKDTSNKSYYLCRNRN